MQIYVIYFCSQWYADVYGDGIPVLIGSTEALFTTIPSGAALVLMQDQDSICE